METTTVLSMRSLTTLPMRIFLRLRSVVAVVMSSILASKGAPFGASLDYAFGAAATLVRSFSFSTVSSRAISRRLSRILSGLSSCFRELRKRRLNSSSRSSPTRVCSSSMFMSRIESALRCVIGSLPSQLVALDEAGPDRQLRRAELHGLLRGLLRDALELEQHAS